MTRGAAVAVIGGGVIGASVAWHLAQNGVRNVVVLDSASRPGGGSTGKATGGFRAQFASAINVRLSLRSREKLRRFRSDTGMDAGYDPVGYLWLASTEQQLESLRAALDVQHAEGLREAREVTAREAGAINPAIATANLVGGAFCPTDGYIRPLRILGGYAEAAMRAGVEFRWGAACTAMEKDSDGRVRTVCTSSGDVDVDAVVNAAGPWAGEVAVLAGVSLPVVPLRRQAAVTGLCPQLPANMPMTIFMGSGFHARMRDGRALICWPSDEQPGEPPELRADPDWIDSVTTMAGELMPPLRQARVDRSRCYAGLYEMSPDEHAILGRSAECPNFYLANGSSGHGVMHSPAIGEIVADMVCGREPKLDVSALRPSRFGEGAEIRAAELI